MIMTWSLIEYEIHGPEHRPELLLLLFLVGHGPELRMGTNNPYPVFLIGPPQVFGHC